MIKNHLGGVKRTQRRVRALARLQDQEKFTEDRIKLLTDVTKRMSANGKLSPDDKFDLENKLVVIEMDQHKLPRIKKEIQTLKSRI